ncbi:MAG: hypothetical protein Q8Q42_01625 [Nanoarchaeota archaeon]|nr:hypothetical protein [Nanoarchaeota archaeon]
MNTSIKDKQKSSLEEILFSKGSKEYAEAVNLLKKSEYSIRIKELLKHPEMGESVPFPGEYGRSNCHGTTLFILKKEEEQTITRPIFVEKSRMESFLENSCEVGDGTIVAFRIKGTRMLAHTAIVIGEISTGVAVFNQPNTGMRFGLTTVERYMDATRYDLVHYFYKHKS